MPVFKFRMREVVRVIGDAEESVVEWRIIQRNGRREYWLRRDWSMKMLWWPEYLIDRVAGEIWPLPSSLIAIRAMAKP